MIEKVKPRIGIFYSESMKDKEVQGMIDAAIEYFKKAGWDINADEPSALAVDAVILYCKMAQNTSAFQLNNHPTLTSFIVQGRAEVENKDGTV